MRFLGLDITRSKPVTHEKLNSVDGRGGWMNLVRESYGGAWQQGVTVEVPNVLSDPTTFACVTLISSEIAKCHLRLTSGTGKVREAVERPAFSPVLRKPNRYQTRIEFISQWMISKLAYGNAYVLKERDARNVVRGMYVLDPRRVKVLVADNGDVYYEVWKDDLSGLHSDSVTIPASELMHDKMNALFHPLVGISPIFASGVAAVQGLNIRSNSSRFFGNGARPGGVLSAPGEIAQDTAARLKAYWDENFTGSNAGKVAVLGDGLKYEPMTMKSTDAQLVEQLKDSAAAICGAFHVPAYMVGVGDAPLNNNVETLWQMFYSQCLQLHMESIEAHLDEGLALPKNLGTEFDLDDLLRMDRGALITAEAEAVNSGLKTTDEARLRLGLGPTPGGDVVRAQQQYYSLESLAERDADKPFSKPTPAPEPVGPPEDETERALAAIRFKYAEALHAA